MVFACGEDGEGWGDGRAGVESKCSPSSVFLDRDVRLLGEEV